MKAILLSLSLLLAAGAASAETITLGTATCGTLKQCADIPNDTGAVISLNGAPGYPYFYVYIDGVQYVAAVASGTEMVNVSLQSFVFSNPTNPAQKQYTGSYAVISGTFSSYKTCNRSGRGQTCLTHWSLIGGTITR